MAELELRSCVHCSQPIAGDARVCLRCRKSALVDLIVVFPVEDPRLLYQATRALEPLQTDATRPKAQTLLATPGARLAGGLTPGAAGAWAEALARLGIGIRQVPATGDADDGGDEPLPAPGSSRAPMVWIVGGLIASLAAAVFIFWPEGPPPAAQASAAAQAAQTAKAAAHLATGPFIWSAGFDEQSSGEVYLVRVVSPAPERPSPFDLKIDVFSTARGAPSTRPVCTITGSITEWDLVDLEVLEKAERWNPQAALPSLVAGDTQLYFGVLKFPWDTACPREGFNLRGTELELLGADPRWTRVSTFRNEGRFELLPTVPR